MCGWRAAIFLKMKKQIDRYVEMAAQFEVKADNAADVTLKLTYKELARSFRMLADHERAQDALWIDAAR